MNRDGSDLYSWITDDSSAISEESRVYLLPSIEFDFWNKILNKKTGYLNVQSQGTMDRSSVTEPLSWSIERSDHGSLLK